MADRRGVRSSSRRITPTPQPPSAATTPQAGRATRRRGTRSATRDFENVTGAPKTARRSTRQSSVASESDQEGLSAPRTKTKAQKQAVADLTIVEEVDTQIDIDDAPGTPPRPQTEAPVPHRSPGALSEMSGTTAISSFSMIEAETLEAKFIIRHLPKLHEVVNEFLNHLAPDQGRMEDDLRHIQEMQKPDSEFNEDYRDYDEEVNLRLSKFRSEHHQYIHIRAVHRALLGPNRDSVPIPPGLDLVLYLANVLIFAKQMIHSDRGGKEIWDALRNLDSNSFPSLFLSALVSADNATVLVSGESTLLVETFQLGLELRTQLAILVLERAANEGDFNPDATLDEVFFHSEASQKEGTVIRGWSMPGLEELPQDLRDQVVGRMSKMREFFPTDTQSLERGDNGDLEGLSANYPWEATILRLLDWVRLRKREIQTAIQQQGGIATITDNLKIEVQHSDFNRSRATSVPQGTPRKKRTSFGRDRRRSSRKFDPHAPDNGAINALKAREKRPVVQVQAESSRQVQQAEEELHDGVMDYLDEQDGVADLLDVQDVVVDHLGQQDEWQPVPDDDQDLPEWSASASGPPQSTAEILREHKEARKLDKENRGGFFARQENAARIKFGDGFDETQPTPGPSGKGKQRQQPSSRKRGRATEFDESDESEAFETNQRNSKAQERRLKAPVAKRVRIDPTFSAAPPSHQPPVRKANDGYAPEELEESLSEVDAPEMTEDTEEVPPIPPSSFAEVKQLARDNVATMASERRRKVRTAWSEDEEGALVEYMDMFPQRYAQILEYDKSKDGLLQDRTQVNIKDKVRNMAITMIRSGLGLSPGFEKVISPTSVFGRKLLDEGFTW